MIHDLNPWIHHDPAVFLASRPALSLSLACVFRGTFENWRRCCPELHKVFEVGQKLRHPCWEPCETASPWCKKPHQG
eukprot:symbB.v1.2.037211.t1/scaffold5432.1/size27254/3